MILVGRNERKKGKTHLVVLIVVDFLCLILRSWTWKKSEQICFKLGETKTRSSLNFPAQECRSIIVMSK
jgi:hypothetical protein